MTETKLVKRGEIVHTQLEGKGCVQRGNRPSIVVSNDAGNNHSKILIVVPLTSKMCKRPLPTHVMIQANDMNKLNENSVALAENIQTISKESVIEVIGSVSEFEMEKIDRALKVALQIDKDNKNGINKNIEDYTFRPANVFNKVQGILELENYIDEEGIEEGTKAYKRLMSSIQIQYDELVKYCKQHGKDVNTYYRPRFLFDKGLKVGVI